MKLQDVLLKAMAKKITWWEAAEMIGVTDRTMRRWRERLARERDTAFRKAARSDLDWIFSVQTERIVARDNTISFRDSAWQLEKTRWRYSLAGCTVTVHEHLDGRISLRYGPHVVASWNLTEQAGKPKPRGGKERKNKSSLTGHIVCE